MRSYPPNSPEAAARIVALVLISDSHVCNSEFEALDEVDAARGLGLSPQAFHGIVQTLCADLLMDGIDSGSMLSHVDDGALASLMAELTQPELQGKVMHIAAAAVKADQHVSDGEASMLDALARHWGLRPLTASGTAHVVELQRS